jgi:glycosyltransferase involved in cell wall biosynthesis
MVTPAYYPVKGGTEAVVQSLCKELNKTGTTADVMTLNMDRKWGPKWRGKTENIDGTIVYKIAGLNWLPIAHSNRTTFGINFIPGRFTRIMKDYDLIHFHEDLTFPIFSLLSRKPKIFHLHGQVDFNAFLLRRITNLYISISKQIEKDLIMLGIPKTKIVYLPNGVDVNLFRPHGKKEDNLLLFVGRIDANKGLHLLLRSLQYLEKSVRLVIIGPASWDSRYHQKILFSIEKENQKGKHKITYLGALERYDIIKWYQRASIFVLPSYYEGFPVTTLEALSCGTPAIVTSVGGNTEVVQNYKNGILIPINDSVAIANGIRFLLENDDKRRRFGEEGRTRVVEHFSLEMMVAKLCRIYKQLINP